MAGFWHNLNRLASLILLAAVGLAQPPAPRPRPLVIKLGQAEEPARVIELVPGPGITHGLSCSGGVCSITTSTTAAAPTWGQISGSLSNQTDLHAALSGKANVAHSHSLADLSQSGASPGQVPQWNGSAWVAVTMSGPGEAPDCDRSAREWL